MNPKTERETNMKLARACEIGLWESVIEKEYVATPPTSCSFRDAKREDETTIFDLAGQASPDMRPLQTQGAT